MSLLTGWLDWLLAHTSIETAFILFILCIGNGIWLSLAIYSWLRKPKSDINLCLFMAELLNNKSAAKDSQSVTAGTHRSHVGTGRISR